MCALHMHIKRTDSVVSGPIVLSSPVASLLQSCVNSAQTVLRILRVIGDEDLLGKIEKPAPLLRMFSF